MKPDFTRKLMKWHNTGNSRDMPWKGESDPYKIWLSEVILQQTRVEQGWNYYEKFIKAFPTVNELAAASDQQVFKMWEGLGYYSRCKNLLITARYISLDLKGKFPSTYEDIIKLKGIGPYTAAAIASFAFNEKRAVVDGNVQRVISRYFGISTPVDNTEGKKLYHTLAQSLIDEDSPGIYNQAIMDFGATICKPRNPLCEQCVEAKECEAYNNDFVHKLPVKEKKLTIKHRWFYYFIIETDDHVYIKKRVEKDIWQNLHEFVLFESDEPVETPEKDFLPQLFKPGTYSIRLKSETILQQLTHQKIYGKFFIIKVKPDQKIPGSDHFPVEKQTLKEHAFPKLIHSFLEKNYLLS